METDLNKLRDRAYKCACNHGFHDEEKSDAHWLMLVITEISEAVEADRKNKHADSVNFFRAITTTAYKQTDERYVEDFERYIKDTVEDEFADIVIRLLDFAGARKMDLSELQNRIKKSRFEECLGGINETFTEMAYSLTEWLCDKNFSQINKVSCAIGGAFTIAYKYHINLFQHIEWKMRYNELRPFKNGKEY